MKRSENWKRLRKKRWQGLLLLRNLLGEVLDQVVELILQLLLLLRETHIMILRWIDLNFLIRISHLILLLGLIVLLIRRFPWQLLKEELLKRRNNRWRQVLNQRGSLRLNQLTKLLIKLPEREVLLINRRWIQLSLINNKMLKFMMILSNLILKVKLSLRPHQESSQLLPQLMSHRNLLKLILREKKERKREKKKDREWGS